MSDGEISVRFTSEEDAQLWDSFVKVAQQARKAGTSLDATNAAAGRVDASLRRFAERTREINATPLERVVAETRKLDSALKANLLTHEEHKRATSAVHSAYMAQLKQAYAEQEKLNAKQAESAKQPAKPAVDPAMKQLGDRLTQDNATPLERYYQRLARVRQAYAATTVSAVTFQRESAKALEELNRELAKTHDQATEGDRDLRKFAAAVKQVETSPLERYNQQLARINQALSKNMLTQREAQAAAKRAADEYQSEARQSEQATNRLGAASRSTAQTTTESFSLMRVSVAGAFAGITMAIKRSLDEIKAEADKAGQSLREQAKPSGTLAQIAESPEELQQLREAARKVREGGGANTMAEAQKFVFSMKSANAMSEIDMFTQLRNYGILDAPDELVKYSAAVRTSFGEQKAGSFRDVLNRAFVAGGPSPEDAAQVMKGTARAGVSAAAQGASVEETMALVGVLSRATGNAEDAGTMVSSLYRYLSTYTPERDKHGQLKPDSPIDKSFRGMSIAQVVNDQELAALSPADLQKVLGRVEAVNALGIIRENWGEISKLIPETRKGAEQDLISKKVSMVEADPALMTAARVERAKGREEVRSERRGQANLAAEAVQTDMRERVRASGESPTMRMFMAAAPTGLVQQGMSAAFKGEAAATAVNWGATGGRWALGDEKFTKGVGAASDFAAEWGLASKRQVEASDAVERSARKQIEAAETLERVSRRLEQSLATPRAVNPDWSRAARAEAAVAPE